MPVHERDLRITPWNGAYVAVLAGETATLAGYDASGQFLGASDFPGEAERPRWTSSPDGARSSDVTDSFAPPQLRPFPRLGR